MSGCAARLPSVLCATDNRNRLAPHDRLPDTTHRPQDSSTGKASFSVLLVFFQRSALRRHNHEDVRTLMHNRLIIDRPALEIRNATADYLHASAGQVVVIALMPA